MKRLPTRAHLLHQHITDSSTCPFCTEMEDQDHLFLGCFQAQEVWERVPALDVSELGRIEDIWDSPGICHMGSGTTHTTAITALLWNIWKRRNGKVFKDDIQLPMVTLCNMSNDLLLWLHHATDPLVSQNL